MTDPDGKLEKPEIVEAQAAEEKQLDLKPGWREAFLVIVEKHRRLRVLQLLASAPGSWLDTGLLQSGLIESGQDVESGRLASMADWLAEAGLVQSRGESPRMLRLTERGLDVAEGRSRATGVAWADGRL